MIENKDLKQIQARGITQEYLDWQLSVFKSKVPFMKLNRPATINDGIIQMDDDELQKNIYEYDNAEEIRKIKFVPASGAASRMFKDLYEYAGNPSDQKRVPGSFINKFITNIEKFAFFEELNKVLQERKLDLRALIKEGNLVPIVNMVLKEEGLNYGNLPKGLLKFHRKNDESVTPFEEHMVEAALYARSDHHPLHVHFSVSAEHYDGFVQLLAEKQNSLEKRFGTKYQIDFSVQSPSTDTLAVDENDEPFRNDDGSLLFRPGGHGALISNLNMLDTDIIFIKNIDNVVPERLVQPTVNYKKALAGKLLKVKDTVHSMMDEIMTSNISMERSHEMLTIIQSRFCFEPANIPDLSNADTRKSYLIDILDRPIRVCGVVKNLGEPGGGPFWAPNSHGDITLQIVESSQVDRNDPGQNDIFGSATHFNPVDLVCCPRRYDGTKFDLQKFVDRNTCFISKKSKDGRQLKALELPGLWNGAMADWITLFVEVPVETFNPVKTVNDLLRPQHQ